MNRYEIHLKDVARILFGQAPLIFFLEVFIRALVIYTFLILIVRWLGKRMTGELTLMEMAVIVTLGAIVSTLMQAGSRNIAGTYLTALIIPAKSLGEIQEDKCKVCGHCTWTPAVMNN